MSCNFFCVYLSSPYDLLKIDPAAHDDEQWSPTCMDTDMNIHNFIQTNESQMSIILYPKIYPFQINDPRHSILSARHVSTIHLSHTLQYTCIQCANTAYTNTAPLLQHQHHPHIPEFHLNISHTFPPPQMKLFDVHVASV